MSDVGRLKRRSGSPFPSVRKSADPFVPEMGEADFTQDVDEFNDVYATAVREPEKTEQNVILDENRRKQFRQRKRQRKKDEEGNITEEDDIFVDIKV
jgi:hypothetical protein